MTDTIMVGGHSLHGVGSCPLRTCYGQVDNGEAADECWPEQNPMCYLVTV